MAAFHSDTPRASQQGGADWFLPGGRLYHDRAVCGGARTGDLSRIVARIVARINNKTKILAISFRDLSLRAC